MAPGFDAVSEAIERLLVMLAITCLATLALAALLALATPPLTRRASAWRRARRARPETKFYVGRFEALRAAVYVVERDGMRSLFEATPAPRGWAEVGERLAEAIAADALTGPGTSRRGRRRLERRLARFPREGFVLERRAVAALEDRSLRRRLVYRLHSGASRLCSATRREPALGSALRRQ